ncbi:MEMO1 family protein C4H3.04c [Babesia sp. Xinjiang]|uniref:MEMO1 family protein C4H3.04c n=1 Tax=Babesia sp. Xinjiang TaxID=462227 RepID=UPI000A226C0E|nr:MEMO1 family protein C4H3.04c [Babesia sp. Xinjiang]ORM40667.1 MEMO1 family protein C4H3.04c [Babesia sp. Xinjiang]
MRIGIHAGSWYDNDVELLRNKIEKALSQSEETPTLYLKYIVVPHAGYTYSLKTASAAFRMVDVTKINTVFILGPSHHLTIRGCGLDRFKYLKTPLGELQVDTDITQKLLKQDGFVEISRRDSEQEHSIEMQLPILKHLLNTGGVNHVKIVPILVGFMDHHHLDIAGMFYTQALKESFSGSLKVMQETLFVLSSDFCHFGRRFGFTRTGYESYRIPLCEAIKKLDFDGIRHILRHDLDGFIRYLKHTQNTICGRYPIELLLKLISISDMELDSRVLSYTQSNECTGINDFSVSYCAIAGVQDRDEGSG